MTLKSIIWIIIAVFLSSLATATLTDNLVVYYTFDNTNVSGTTVKDVHTNHYDATNDGAYTGETGKLNQAFYYTAASNTEVEAVNVITPITKSTPFTINVWANNNGSASYATVGGLANKGGQFFAVAKVNNTGGMGCNMYNGAQETTDFAAVGAGWNMITCVWYPDATGAGKVATFVNGVLLVNSSLNCSTCGSNNDVIIGGRNTNEQNWNGMADEFAIWNRSISQAEITELYNSGNALSYYSYSPPVSPSNFSITATDEWNSSALNISVWVDGTSYGTNTTVTTGILQNSTTTHNITIGSTNYFNRTYLNYNVSSNLAASLHQAEVCFNASAKVSGAAITTNNFTIGSTTRTSCFNVSAGTYNVLAQKTGWYNKNQTFTITTLQNNTQTVVNISYANLTISAKDGTTNATLTGYSLTIKSLNFTTWVGETTTGATNYSFYLINGTYNVTIDAPGYELTNAQANITVNGNTNYTFTLYKENSIRIYIFDEITNAPILSNITIRFTDNSSTWENTTDTSTLFVYNLTPSTYTLLFYGSGYSTRTYTVTVGNRTTQTLNAYMISSNYSTTLTIKDVDSADVLSNVSIGMYKLINSTWTVVESKYSDISGRAVFYYDPIGSYKFYLSLDGYTDYVFFLNPILFSAYDVYMTKTSILNASADYDKIAIIYAPTSFQNNKATTFNFIISSPDGLLTEYGINITLPNTSKVGSVGVNAIGSQLSALVNITNATVFDRVRLDYYYITTTAGRKNYTLYFPVEFNTSASDMTFLSNKNKTYGLGIFERILIVTLTVLFVVGIGTLVGQPIPAMALGLFCFGYMAFIGFVPLWAILPSMFIGVIFLVWKSGGY